eukprot:TRINITY_DN92089_c0_g1_i1.p1 TRINITY_DN92089_c0_g1~~TRINITY_DN92089_c0_g1_i1.p1  ORF type:complete len:346 (+),score=39.38 TRINITY_DN92089_c0_g1_i1:185-1222(+)
MDPYQMSVPSHGYGGPPPHEYAPPPHGYGYPAHHPPPHHLPPHPHHYPPPPGYGHPPPGYPYGPPPPGYPGYPPPMHGWPPPPGAYWPPPPYWGHHPLPDRSRSRSPRREGKYTCRFFIGIENEDTFKVAKRIIGANGARMKEILKKSGGTAKLRLRGKGSGFMERDTEQESPEPLQLCISCPESHGYEIARRCAEELLLKVYDDYEVFCKEQGREEAIPTIKMTERHLGDAGGSGGDSRGGGGGGSDGANRRRGGRGKKRKGAPSQTPRSNREDTDHGEPPDGAPEPEEIERLISDRNNCRKHGDYAKADSIRDDLKSRGVVLSDEKGAHGDGLNVTSWRYWND